MSLALFGAAAGGICVYLLPRLFERRPLGVVLGLTALAYSISVVVALLIFIGTPVMPVGSIAGMLNLGIVYVDLALPFFFGGLCLAVGIKYLARNVSAVYFSDLVGAGAGCLLVIPALDWFGGPGAILFAA